jgi:uncharacterized protein
VLAMATWMAHRQFPSFPLAAVIGGVTIGASASLLLLFNGRIAGISGIVAGLVRPIAGETSWRAFFVAGLLIGGAVVLALRPQSFSAPSVSLLAVVVAGLFVGFGTRLGSGCTSGHGVCGVSRLSVRSIVATLTFMTTGAVTTLLVHHGGSLR